MKKKIELTVDTNLKESLELKANNVITNINELITALEGINYQGKTSEDLIKFIQKYGEINSNNENDLIVMKHYSEIVEFRRRFPSVIKEKSVEMFRTPEDADQVQSIIQKASEINGDIQTIRNLSLETFVQNDEFVYNNKIDTVLKEIYTTFCSNKKQRDIKNLVESISALIKSGIKDGLITKSYSGYMLSQFLNVDSGEIDYNMIRRVQG